MTYININNINKKGKCLPSRVKRAACELEIENERDKEHQTCSR